MNLLKCHLNNVTMRSIFNVLKSDFISLVQNTISSYLSFDFELKCDIDVLSWDSPDHTLNVCWLFDFVVVSIPGPPMGERLCLFEKEFPWLWSHYDHSILQTSFEWLCEMPSIKRLKEKWHSIIASCQLSDWLECRFCTSSDWLWLCPTLLINLTDWLFGLSDS